MSNKKYSKEFKLKLIKEHEDNGVSFYQLEKDNNIVARQIVISTNSIFGEAKTTE